MKQWVAKCGWKDSGNGRVFITSQEDLVKTKNITEKIEFENVAGIMAHCIWFNSKQNTIWINTIWFVFSSLLTLQKKWLFSNPLFTKKGSQLCVCVDGIKNNCVWCLLEAKAESTELGSGQVFPVAQFDVVDFTSRTARPWEPLNTAKASEEYTRTILITRVTTEFCCCCQETGLKIDTKCHHIVAQVNDGLGKGANFFRKESIFEFLVQLLLLLLLRLKRNKSI